MRLDRGGFSGWGHQARQWGERCYRRWGRIRAMVVYSIMRRGGFRPRVQTQVGKVVVYNSDSRGGSCFNDMLYGREVVGIGGGAIGARRCYARMRSPRAGTVPKNPKNPRREWGRVTIVFGRVIGARNHLPSVRAIASLMPGLAVVAIRCLGEGGTFGVATTARRFVAAAGSRGRRCVTTIKSCPGRPAGGGSLAEGLPDPIGARWSSIRLVQEVAQAKDVVD